MKATKKIHASFDVDVNPYSKNEYDLKDIFYIHQSDSSFREWKDQNIIRFGLEFELNEAVTILAGYGLVPAITRPLNYNYEVELPKADLLSFGVSVTILRGRFDVVYQFRHYRDVDIYFTRNSFNRIDNSNLMLGYTFTL